MLWTYPTPSWDWNYHEDYLDVWFSDWAFPSTNNTVNVDNSLGYTKIYPEEAPTGIDHGLDVGEKTPGAFVEYDKSELKERIISEIGHALKLNPTVLVEGVTTQVPPEKHSIYKYKPHHRILIRPFSNTINYSDSLEN